MRANHRFVVGAAIACGFAPFVLAGSDRFIESDQDLGNDATTALALGDIDGDGDIDAVSPTYVGPILVRINQGDATFVPGETIQEGSLSGNLALHDLDDDGDLDIFIVNHSFETTVYYNDGDGTFTPSGQNLGSASSHGLAMGDIDNDGDIDAFINDISGHYNAPVLNDGDGGFAYGQNNSLPLARETDLGDVNGDGHLDVFLVHAGSGPNQPQNMPDRVLFGDGTGSFVDSGQQLGMDNGFDARLGDFDDDGDLDAMVANTDFFDSNPIGRVYVNDGGGGFTDSGQAIGASAAFNISLGDIDLDDDLDAIVSHSGPNLEEIWLNDGSGQFTLDGEFGPPMQGGRRVSELADLDGDGDLDVFTVVGGVGDRVYLNQTIVEATLADFIIVFGQHLSGGLDELNLSDDAYLRVRSQFGFTATEPNIADLVVRAETTIVDPASLALRIEARSNTPGTTMRLRLRDWSSGLFDLVHQYALGTTDAMETVEGISAAGHVRPSDGRIELSLRSSVMATFTAFGFTAAHDLVEVLVRD